MSTIKDTQNSTIELDTHEPIEPIDLDIEVLPPLPCPAEGRAPVNKIPDETREQFAQAVFTEGMTAREACRKFGINKNSATPILREYFASMVEANNFSMVSSLDEITGQMLTRIKQNIQNIPIQQLVVAFGILADKRQALLNKIPRVVGQAGLSLRIAWRDGSGAVELNTGNDSG